MRQPAVASCSVSQFCVEYDDHLDRLRGLSASTRKLHRYVVRRFLTLQFPDERINWNQLRFTDVVEFLKEEFARLRSRDTQRAWLMVLRSVLRYLAGSSRIPQGWDAALPKITSYSQSRLPKNLTNEQLHALFSACQERKRRHARYRALLLLCLRLGLRVQEVANLAPGDIDWKNGCLRVRCTKTYNDRVLPFPQDVGDALVAHLRNCREHPTRVFEPLRPPCTAQRCYIHVLNSIRYLFSLAGVTDRGTHSLRHTAATQMVNSGASFKEVADVLGHKSIATTLIYAKLDMKSLGEVALPWPGGAR
jgi:integrase/recombinase XerD